MRRSARSRRRCSRSGRRRRMPRRYGISAGSVRRRLERATRCGMQRHTRRGRQLHPTLRRISSLRTSSEGNLSRTNEGAAALAVSRRARPDPRCGRSAGLVGHFRRREDGRPKGGVPLSFAWRSQLAVLLVGLLASGCTFITRVSVDIAGGDPNFPSQVPSMSADGRYVAFDSFATDLVPGDGNDHRTFSSGTCRPAPPSG